MLQGVDPLASYDASRSQGPNGPTEKYAKSSKLDHFPRAENEKKMKPPHSIPETYECPSIFGGFSPSKKKVLSLKISKLLMVQKSHSQPPDMYETLQIMGDMYGIFTISTGWVCRMSEPISTNQIAFAGPTCRLLLQDVTFPKHLTRFGSRKVCWAGNVGRGTKQQKNLELFCGVNGKNLDFVWILWFKFLYDV